MENLTLNDRSEALFALGVVAVMFYYFFAARLWDIGDTYCVNSRPFRWQGVRSVGPRQAVGD